MLFNADKEVKRSIFNDYIKEAREAQNKKELEKQKRLEEERAMLALAKEDEDNYLERIKTEKMKMKNEIMNSYKKMLEQNGSRRLRHSKLEDIQINNYGYDPNKEDPIFHLQRSQRSSTFNNPMKNQMSDYNSVTNPILKERMLIRRQDHMANYLTDSLNEGEVRNYFQNQRKNQQELYKEFLDQQVNIIYYL